MRCAVARATRPSMPSSGDRSTTSPLPSTGNLGPLDALRERRWPYPVAIKGDIGGEAGERLHQGRRARRTTTLDPLDLAWGTLALKGQVLCRARRRPHSIRVRPLVACDVASGCGLRGVAACGAARRRRPAWRRARNPRRRRASSISDRPCRSRRSRGLDLDGTLAIGELPIDERNKLRAVNLKVASARGKARRADAAGVGATAARSRPPVDRRATSACARRAAARRWARPRPRSAAQGHRRKRARCAAARRR